MRETTVGGAFNHTVCNPLSTHTQTPHASDPPFLCTFVWEQLSSWKYLILFLIAQAPITVIKLSFRVLHCFSSDTTDRRGRGGCGWGGVNRLNGASKSNLCAHT